MLPNGIGKLRHIRQGRDVVATFNGLDAIHDTLWPKHAEGFQAVQSSHPSIFKDEALER